MLQELRLERGISQRQLADDAGVDASVVHRAERGGNAKLGTWGKLFEGLGYLLLFETTELAEETSDILTEEHDRRLERRAEGLCAGKRRFH
ncbi:MAG: helix-turn-helix transcriptional regulator [Elusimicrobiota bacterium]